MAEHTYLNCSAKSGDEWPRSRDFIANLVPAEQAIIGVCSIFCLINIIIFIDNTLYVWNKNSSMRRTVVATLWMIGLTPVLSVIALLGMTIPRLHIFQDILSVICIAVVMYKFVQLMRAYGRYYEQFHESVRTNKLRFNVGPFCCCCFCLPTAEINKSNDIKVRWSILQYPFISTATSVLTMVTWLNGNYTPGEWIADNPYPYLTTTRVVSVLVAIYGLNILVKPCMDAMKSLMIRPKFISLRLSMLLYALQGILFNLLVEFTDLFEIRGCFSGAVMGNFYQNLVFCIEMFLLTLLNFWSYRRVLSPTGGSNDNLGAASSNTVDMDGRDIVKDLERYQQIQLEEVFRRDREAGLGAYNLNESPQRDSKDRPGDSKSNRHMSVGKQDFAEMTNTGDSRYTNNVTYVVGGGAENPALDIRL